MKILLASLLCLVTMPALAATRSVTLSVPGMTCAACPITVRTALSQVKGVIGMSVAFKRRQITVRYDDHKTNVAALTRATADAGYPSHVVRSPQS